MKVLTFGRNKLTLFLIFMGVFIGVMSSVLIIGLYVCVSYELLDLSKAKKFSEAKNQKLTVVRFWAFGLWELFSFLKSPKAQTNRVIDRFR
jgi:hypothetical protein